MTRPRSLVAVAATALSVVLVAACADGDRSDEVRADEPTSTAAAATTVGDVFVDDGETSSTTTGPDTSDPSTTTTAAPTTSTTTSAAPPTTTTTLPTTTTTTLAAAEGPIVADGAEALAFPVDTEVEIGRSIQDRPITVIRRGDPDGTRVLAVGAIHGNEDDGMAIVDVLSTLEVPDGVELWLVRTMNPDGNAMQIRHNANGVDLNRNFPHRWGPIAEPGNWQYAGTGPASEPEVRAIVPLGDAVAPDLTLWYHQDLYRINPASGRDGAARARYAELTGLPIVEVTGGTYTGTASQWSRRAAAPDGVGFTVELGDTLSPEEARVHAEAVLTVASEL